MSPSTFYYFNFKNPGYCPERDTYMENMTVKETLSILSLIRGISPGRVDYHINKVAKTLKFEECLELKLCKLGDVSRRTVTIGVAFLGEPDILILDEPTKGLNREAKKILFTNIKEIIRTKRTVVITETDAREICSVTSRIVCLETTKVPSRLKEPKKLCKKSKTSETAPGLTISITLKDRGKEEDELDKLFSNCVDKTASRHCSKADMFVQCSRILEPAARAVREFILEMFPCAVVRHCGGLSMDFRVPASNEISQGVPNDVLYVTTPTGTNPIQLWEVYTALENEKCALNIENYKITVYKRAQVRMFLSYDPNIKGLKVCKTCM